MEGDHAESVLLKIAPPRCGDTDQGSAFGLWPEIFRQVLRSSRS